MNKRPTGATHVSDSNVYYKLQGKFWFVYKDDGWYAISGNPVIPLTKL